MKKKDNAWTRALADYNEHVKMKPKNPALRMVWVTKSNFLYEKCLRVAAKRGHDVSGAMLDFLKQTGAPH